MRLFECGIRYEKTLENGMQKKVTELYIVDALSFTEASAASFRWSPKRLPTIPNLSAPTIPRQTNGIRSKLTLLRSMKKQWPKRSSLFTCLFRRMTLTMHENGLTNICAALWLIGYARPYRKPKSWTYSSMLPMRCMGKPRLTRAESFRKRQLP